MAFHKRLKTNNSFRAGLLGGFLYHDNRFALITPFAFLDDSVAPPVDLASLTNVNFYCSPAAAVARGGEGDGSTNVGAATATASFRFSKFMGAGRTS